tara:strand:+ start:220 stop:468 length:249 start_codon:yes stop_codon:yes gene_type:complete
MINFVKTSIFLFFLLYGTHSLAKSSEYYQQTLINVLTECDNSKCRNEIFEMEINKAFFNLISAIMDQLRWEISQKEKDILNK